MIAIDKTPHHTATIPGCSAFGDARRRRQRRMGGDACRQQAPALPEGGTPDGR